MEAQGGKLRVIVPVVVGVAVLGAIVAWAVMQTEKPANPTAEVPAAKPAVGNSAADSKNPVSTTTFDKKLLAGKWKDTKGSILQIKEDGTATLPLVVNKSFPVNVEDITGTATIHLEARTRTSWELIGDTLTLIGKGIEDVSVNECKLDSPDFLKKFGEEKFKQMQSDISTKMTDQFTKSFVGTHVTMQVISLEASTLQLKDSSGEITALTRVE